LRHIRLHHHHLGHHLLLARWEEASEAWLHHLRVVESLLVVAYDNVNQ
jgi:hypothetical protein